MKYYVVRVEINKAHDIETSWPLLFTTKDSKSYH